MNKRANTIRPYTKSVIATRLNRPLRNGDSSSRLATTDFVGRGLNPCSKGYEKITIMCVPIPQKTTSYSLKKSLHQRHIAIKINRVVIYKLHDDMIDENGRCEGRVAERAVPTVMRVVG